MKLDGLKKFHFIGIGGVGMSALAKILIESGCEVSGSDMKASPTLDMLKSLGAKIFVGHDAKNIFDDGKPWPEVIVCSSAIPADNPEVIAAAQNTSRRFTAPTSTRTCSTRAKALRFPARTARPRRLQ